MPACRRRAWIQPLAQVDSPDTIEIGGKAIRIQRAGIVRVATLRDELCDEGVEDPEAIIRELKARTKADLFNFRQQLPHTQPQCAFHLEWDNLAVLEIESYEHWWNKQIRNDARRMVRKAEKHGIEIRLMDFSDELVAGIKNIWDETPFRQGRLSRHYHKDFETVKRENSTFMDRAQFLGAYYHGEMVGFNKTFYTGVRADHVVVMSKIAFRDMAPTNALLARSVELAAQRGARYMTYAKYSYGKKGEDSLSDFKSRNGFTKDGIPRYFVPLTSRGAFALRLGWHKGFKEAMPAFLLRGVSKSRGLLGKLIVRCSSGSSARRPEAEASPHRMVS